MKISRNEYLNAFIFRKLNKQKNTELVEQVKVVVNNNQVDKVLVNNNLVDKVLVVPLNKELLLLRLKSEELTKKLLNLDVNNIKSSINYELLPFSSETETFPISFRYAISCH